MRWLRELFRPALVCERTGDHALRSEERRFYRYPSGWSRAVADDITEERQICRRCGHVAHDWTETRKNELSGLSMAEHRWDELRKNGRLDQ